MIEDIKSSVNNDIFERFLKKKNMDLDEEERDSENEESSSSENWKETYEEDEFKGYGKIESNINKMKNFKWIMKSLCKVILMIYIKNI